MSKEKTPSKYRIDLCDGYYAMKDNYCYTLYNTRNKQASALHPDIDESETTDINLGYFDGFDNMLWAMVNNSVDAKALSKNKAITIKEYIQMYEEIKDKLISLTGIRV
jgi:hypothetical protein